MRKILLLLAFTAGAIITSAQTVGIGTASPDTATALDIFSSRKGILIPRLLDTATVVKPVEGTIIYNRSNRSPYYYDGNQWLPMGGRVTNTTATNVARITYTVSSLGFNSTEQELFASSNGISLSTSMGGGSITPGASNFQSFSIVKAADINSTSFNKAVAMGTRIPSIELKFYAAGATTPFISYKLQNVYVESFSASGSSGGMVTESLSLVFEIYGFKDWVNNLSFGYNLVNRTVVPY